MAYSTSAAQGLVILKHQYMAEVANDELNRLKAKYDEVNTKYDNNHISLYQNEPIKSADQHAQVSRILDVTGQTNQSQAQDRKREDAAHQTKLKMDMLKIDLEVMIQAVKKFTSCTVLEDHLLDKALKSRSECQTQATALSKKIVEINSAIVQWALS